MINEKNAKLFCNDDISLIENYEEAVNDKTRKWVVHHRRGTIYNRNGLKEIGEYYKRPAIELIFMTEEEHKRLHNIGENNPFFGKHHSEEAKEKISNAQIGNHNKPTKQILQYSKEGEFIKEWTSAKEASRVIGINPSHITECCKGKLKSAYGFVWTYA